MTKALDSFPKLSSIIMTGLVWLAHEPRLGAAVVSPDTNLTASEQLIVDAASVEAAPHFNGAKTIAIRPGTPLVFAASVGGRRPLQFSAESLPPGLALDKESGLLTGALAAPGEFRLKLSAQNDAGSASTEIKIICGDTLAATPPMGWNSYDAFGDAVVESEVISNAAWMKEHLQPFGWDTIVVDFRWYDAKADGVRAQNPEGDTMDEFGRMIPAPNRFPSSTNGLGFKAISDQLHAMGLKFGIHIMRGIPRRAVEQNLPIHGTSFHASDAVRPVGDPARTCRWNRDMYGVDASTDAGKAWYRDIAAQYASWGVDYIKCDDIANLQNGTNRYPRLEVEALANGLRASGRSIVLSLSPGPALLAEKDHLQANANLWRVSGDFWDNWRSLNRNFDLLASWSPSAGAGHWPDGDMIPFGHICIRNCDVHPERWSRFTRDEQVTLMSLWSLASSPLMLGMNLPDNDAWTTALLTNPEVLAVDQQMGEQPAVRHAAENGGPEIWTKKLADGSQVAGFFNRTAQPLSVNIAWQSLGYPATVNARDLWRRKDLGTQTNFLMELPAHGCALVEVK